MPNDRPWLANYSEGIPANINADAYPSLVAFIDEHLKKYKDLPAYSCMNTELTFKEVDKMADQFGAYLVSRGLKRGDKIALMMPNLLQYPIALFGALRAGLVVVNTNPLYTPREMKHQFTDAGVTAIVISENFAANLEQIIGDTDISTVILCSIGEMHSAVKRTIVNFAVRNIKKMVPKYDLANTVTFKQALSAGKKFTLPKIEHKPDDVILLQYTGGTTGVAKGAMLTNRNLVANMMQIKACMSPFLVDRAEVALCPLPLYHIFAFTVNCLSMMSIGATNVLVTNPRDLDSIVKEFKRYDITLMTGVNTLFNALVNNDDFKQLDFKLKITSGGGMAVQDVVARRWKEVTGCYLSEGYGMTEASPVVSTNAYDDSVRIGTIGLPLPSTDMRIVKEDGTMAAYGERGEIEVKGPQVMKGYYNRPEATAEVISDGWLKTGDIGIMAEDGFTKIVDRKKDMILVSGFNVFPNEVEGVIAEHPKVLECAAVGIPHPKSGEVVKIFVVKKDPSLTEEELITFCKDNLTGYKIPKAVEFRDELPKTNVGKILRRELRTA